MKGPMNLLTSIFRVSGNEQRDLDSVIAVRTSIDSTPLPLEQVDQAVLV